MGQLQAEEFQVMSTRREHEESFAAISQILSNENGVALNFLLLEGMNPESRRAEMQVRVRGIENEYLTLKID